MGRTRRPQTRIEDHFQPSPRFSRSSGPSTRITRAAKVVYESESESEGSEGLAAIEMTQPGTSAGRAQAGGAEEDEEGDEGEGTGLSPMKRRRRTDRRTLRRPDPKARPEPTISMSINNDAGNESDEEEADEEVEDAIMVDADGFSGDGQPVLPQDEDGDIIILDAPPQAFEDDDDDDEPVALPSPPALSRATRRSPVRPPSLGLSARGKKADKARTPIVAPSPVQHFFGRSRGKLQAYVELPSRSPSVSSLRSPVPPIIPKAPAPFEEDPVISLGSPIPEEEQPVDPITDDEDVPLVLPPSTGKERQRIVTPVEEDSEEEVSAVLPQSTRKASLLKRNKSTPPINDRRSRTRNAAPGSSTRGSGAPQSEVRSGRKQVDESLSTRPKRVSHIDYREDAQTITSTTSASEDKAVSEKTRESSEAVMPTPKNRNAQKITSVRSMRPKEPIVLLDFRSDKKQDVPASSSRPRKARVETVTDEDEDVSSSRKSKKKGTHASSSRSRIPHVETIVVEDEDEDEDDALPELVLKSPPRKLKRVLPSDSEDDQPVASASRRSNGKSAEKPRQRTRRESPVASPRRTSNGNARPSGSGKGSGKERERVKRHGRRHKDEEQRQKKKTKRVANSDSEDEEDEGEGGGAAEDLELDEPERFKTKSRLRSKVKETPFQRKLRKVKEKRMGIDKDTSESEEEDEEEDSRSDTSDSAAEAYEEEDFIVDDGDGGEDQPRLPAEFSNDRLQPLEYKFKVVFHYLVMLVMQGPALLPLRGEAADYIGSHLVDLRRKIRGHRDSRVRSQIWRTEFVQALETFPTFYERHIDESHHGCDACHMSGRISRWEITLEGTPYDSDTHEPIDSETDNSSDEEDTRGKGKGKAKAKGKEKEKPTAKKDKKTQQRRDSSSRDSDEHSRHGHQVLGEDLPRKFYMGRFCKARAQVYHAMSHWEDELFMRVRGYYKDLLRAKDQPIPSDSEESSSSDDSAESEDERELRREKRRGRRAATVKRVAALKKQSLPSLKNSDAITDWMDKKGWQANEWRWFNDLITRSERLEVDGRQDE